MGTVKPAAVKGGRFIAGDPLRGIACLVVLFWHTVVNAAGVTPPQGVSPYYQAELGIFGRPAFTLMISVWLFFALSGYLIAGPFVRAVVRGDGRKPRAGAYARNRALRILPGYWFWLIVTLVVVGTNGASVAEIGQFFGFAHVYDASTNEFTHRMVQAWTLDVELVFYILLPLTMLPLASLLRGRGTPWQRASVVLVGCALVTIASLAVDIRWPTGGRIVPGSAWAFAPGVALATVEPLLRPRFHNRGFGRAIAWGLLFTAAATYLIESYLVTYTSNIAQNLASLVAVGALLAAPLVYQWTTDGAWRLLDNRFLHWLGVRAYGVYLVHVMLLFKFKFVTQWAGSTQKALLTTYPLVLGLAIAAGAFSYRFIERPFLDARMPWRTPDAPPVPEQVAPALQPVLQQQA